MLHLRKMMRNYQYLGLYIVGGVCLSPLPTHAGNREKKPPHIILIMTDQQRWDALGCTGDGTVISPNLDNLAHEGHLFRNAYTSAPSSTPARAGLLTGMSPWNHGLLGYGQVAEHYKYEMPRMLGE
ncbi:hypothetical protein SDC9_116893 [bioreactor metagenome]|uniref:Sulfatase N-terminal domain-containing protein n=1 Tax=bioreactor metagenome TaxID=1076179 RepID=A0A645BXH0_9ZZZZ